MNIKLIDKLKSLFIKKRIDYTLNMDYNCIRCNNTGKIQCTGCYGEGRNCAGCKGLKIRICGVCNGKSTPK